MVFNIAMVLYIAMVLDIAMGSKSLILHLQQTQPHYVSILEYILMNLIYFLLRSFPFHLVFSVYPEITTFKIMFLVILNYGVLAPSEKIVIINALGKLQMTRIECEDFN